MKTNAGDTICLRLSIINPEMSKDILQNFLDTMQTGDGFCGTKLTAIARHDVFDQSDKMHEEIKALKKSLLTIMLRNCRIAKCLLG